MFLGHHRILLFIMWQVFHGGFNSRAAGPLPVNAATSDGPHQPANEPPLRLNARAALQGIIEGQVDLRLAGVESRLMNYMDKQVDKRMIDLESRLKGRIAAAAPSTSAAAAAPRAPSIIEGIEKGMEARIKAALEARINASVETIEGRFATLVEQRIREMVKTQVLSDAITKQIGDTSKEEGKSVLAEACKESISECALIEDRIIGRVDMRMQAVSKASEEIEKQCCASVDRLKRDIGQTVKRMNDDIELGRNAVAALHRRVHPRSTPNVA